MMRTSNFHLVCVALVCMIAAGCIITRIPDLPSADAAKIVSRAPEFNRYARLLNVERVEHMKDSMDSVSYGDFTFVYLSAPPNATPIQARADFRYKEGNWYLGSFWYGCPTDCHHVDVYDGPTKRR